MVEGGDYSVLRDSTKLLMPGHSPIALHSSICYTDHSLLLRYVEV